MITPAISKFSLKIHTLSFKSCFDFDLLHHKVDWCSTRLLPYKSGLVLHSVVAFQVDWCSTRSLPFKWIDAPLTLLPITVDWCSTQVCTLCKTQGYGGFKQADTKRSIFDSKAHFIFANRFPENHSVSAYHQHWRQKVWYDWYPLVSLLQVFYTELGCGFSCHYWVR